MKHFKFLSALAALLAAACLLTACGKPAPAPAEPSAPVEEEKPVEAPEKVPEKVPEKPSAEPEPEEAPEAAAPAEEEPAAEDSLQAIRMQMEPSAAVAGILYLGYWDQGPLNSDFFATLDPQTYLGQYGFLAQISDERLIANDGYEVYCIVPADPNAKVTVTQWLELEENNYKPEPGAVLYEANSGEPFLLQANVSDILSNVSINITDNFGNKLENYQPQISLRDGTVALPGEDQPVMLDFTIYDLAPMEDGPICTSFDLYVPNEAADNFDLIYLEDQLLGANYLLSLLVDHGVLPDTLQFNAFSEDGTQLALDLGESFETYLNTMGSTGEILTLGSLVNTFLSAYGAGSMVLTVDGRTIETGHNIYDEPFTFITIQG